ncbi:MAG: ribonuclease HII [Ignavibacteriales bacterium]|nr:ribonuclease HII [Ignavibacteriales bacterium]
MDLLEYERKYWSQGVRLVAGIDEAGRGPLAGPVVAAAVIFGEGEIVPGVTDSKKIPEKRRERLFGEISMRAIGIGIGIVDHAVIDRINILQASSLAMNKALTALTPVPHQLLVDGNFFRHELFPVENIIKGDALSHSIGAASIVAKVTRDRMMYKFDTLYPEYGFAKHKGYGTPQHMEAIRRYGYCPIHRRSFHIELG